MQVSPNSILVVDLPVQQNSFRPEPYFYWLNITDVIDYELADKSTTNFDWLIFKQPDNKIAVFDDSTIRVYQLNEKNEIQSLVTEAVHNLGFVQQDFTGLLQ